MPLLQSHEQEALALAASVHAVQPDATDDGVTFRGARVVVSARARVNLGTGHFLTLSETSR